MRATGDENFGTLPENKYEKIDFPPSRYSSVFLFLFAFIYASGITVNQG